MRTRFLAALLIAAAALPAAADAQSGQWVKPPDKLPHIGGGDRTQNLDFLFGALRLAPDDITAKAIEQRIWALWTVSHSDTANLLMTRVKTAIESKDLDVAIQLLDAIIKVKPDYVEAWNRRATIYYMKKDYGHALADIREVLKREPRHFGALAGMAQILETTGRKQLALQAWQKVLDLYPMQRSAQEKVSKLSEELAGEAI